MAPEAEGGGRRAEGGGRRKADAIRKLDDRSQIPGRRAEGRPMRFENLTTEANDQGGGRRAEGGGPAGAISRTGRGRRPRRRKTLVRGPVAPERSCSLAESGVEGDVRGGVRHWSGDQWHPNKESLAVERPLAIEDTGQGTSATQECSSFHKRRLWSGTTVEPRETNTLASGPVPPGLDERLTNEANRRKVCTRHNRLILLLLQRDLGLARDLT